MISIRKNLGLQQIANELETLYASEGIKIIKPHKALKDESITQSEHDFLEWFGYQYLIIGEQTIFASKGGELFSELYSE